MPVIAVSLRLPYAGPNPDVRSPLAGSQKLAWSGLGDEPARPDVNGIDDLVAMVLGHMGEPVNILAQSMGVLIAVRTRWQRPRS